MLTRRQLLVHGAAALCAGTGGLVRAQPQDKPEAAAAHLLNRLGYGPRPGQLREVARDPQRWLEAQLRPSQIALPATLRERLDESRFIGVDPMDPVRKLAALSAVVREETKAAAGMGSQETPQLVSAKQALTDHRLAYQEPAARSRIHRALESPAQLHEAMVDFWFNHFNVSQDKGWCRVLTGHYEHYAIRPYALGRFRDLLGATAQHPAMLYYLDNWTSVGVPRGRQQGLNENYARELMELHTLGVDGGYAQKDVTELARMLTGWTLVPAAQPSAPPGPPGDPRRIPGFWFDARRHDPNEKQWLGRRVPPGGQEEGERALDVLAAHPATARHVCFKLAQYFVADAPDPALVQRLAQVFLAEDGQIVPVLRALFKEPAFWSPADGGGKGLFKTPMHYSLSVLRAVGATPSDVNPLLAHLRREGMPLYRCATPDGYKTTEAAWLNPAAMQRRIEFALRVARGGLDPSDGPQPLPGLQELMADLGPLVTPQTRELALRNKADARLAVSLVLAGPGMMRR